MMYPNFYEEYLVWLGLISVTLVIFHYWAFYLVLLWTVYFFAVRLLERITIPDLHKKAVLISGCDSGFGRDLALKCLNNGMPVFAGCLTEKGISEIKEEAKGIKNGEKLLKAIQLNICSEESVKKMREVIDESGLGLFAVVNNAGIGDNRAFDDWQTPAMYQRFFDINTLGHIRVTHAVKDLIKRSKGRIVSVASICAKVAMPTGGPYNVSKFAIAAYCDTIRVELEQFGVHVSILEPGFFKTPQANPDAAKADTKMVWDRLPDSIKEEFGEDYLKWMQTLVAGYLGYKCKPVPHFVVEAYFNAITSAWPRRRYQIGYDAMFQFNILSYMPTRLQQNVFYFYLKYWANLPQPAKMLSAQ